MIQITSKAAQQIMDLVALKNSEESLGLRLSIEKGGCAGLQYVMKIALQQEGDFIIKEGEAIIFIEPASITQLKGCTLDYEEGLSGAGFRMINPQAVRSCGCGTSFEPKK